MIEGIYDINIEYYHAVEGVSRSGVMELLKSPAHYYYKYEQQKQEKKATKEQIFGQALHMYLLERAKFERHFYIVEKFDKRTKAGKERLEKLKYLTAGKQIITEDEFELILDFEKTIKSNDFLTSATSGAYEKSIFWTDKDTGVLCKCRPDIWNSDLHFVCDLKTALYADKDSFIRAVIKYGYHVQAAMIKDGLKEATGEDIEHFVFVTFEKTDLKLVGTYILDDAAIQEGRHQYKKALKIYKDCKDKNNWPGYEMETISLPAYIFKGDENVSYC